MSKFDKIGANSAQGFYDFRSEEYEAQLWRNFPEQNQKNPNSVDQALSILEGKEELDQLYFWKRASEEFIIPQLPIFQPSLCDDDVQGPKEKEQRKMLQNQEEVSEVNHTTPMKKEKSFMVEEKELDKMTPKTEPQNSEENLSIISELQLEEPFKEDERKILKCNCKKSKCLKLYCECFRSGEVCSKDCECNGCENNSDNEEKRQKIIQEIIEKDDNAFLEKVKYNGCRCTKNHCSKNYCDCYRLGVGCGKYCQCLDCENCGGRKQKKRKGKGKGKGRVKARF